jgi:glycosyltransferase involved in cell wall biosynthesis
MWRARYQILVVGVRKFFMRVAVLWTRLSGYLSSSLRSLQAKGATLLVVNEAATADTPFDEAEFGWIERRHQYVGRPEFATVMGLLDAFRPDVILASWHIPAYQRACSRLRGRAVRVGCADNQWRGTLKQQLGRLTAAIHLRRFYDAMFVAGGRQAVWARKMGYAEDRIWKGLYSCDVDAFAKCPAGFSRRDKTFLYAGRLSKEKGIANLCQGYELYRRNCRNPWPLIVAGDGPLRLEVQAKRGVDWKGFVQPSELPLLFAEASCFVIASTFEPWCVALHEAASASLPIICTSECGAAIHLVRNEYNGYVVSPDSTSELARAMERISSAPEGQLAAMAYRSSELSKQFTPDRWSSCVLEKTQELSGLRGKYETGGQR